MSRPSLVLKCAASVQQCPLRWLWPARIPRGKLSLIAGDPGLGKSLVCADLVARVTTGAAWPGENLQQKREPETAWIISCEDDEADTLRPRLEAAGADCSRVYFPQGVRSANVDHFSVLRLDRHVAWIEEACESVSPPALIVIDPITAYLGDVDAHNQAEVRGLLAPLSMLAQRFSIAIVGVMHLNKKEDASGVYRISGSLAFPAAARAVWWVRPDPDAPDGRLLLPAKFNLGPQPCGMKFTVKDAGLGVPKVDFGDEVSPVCAHAPESPENLGRIDEAKDFLYDALADTPKPAKEILKAAKEAGISPATLSRARAEIGIVARRVSPAGAWFMELPPRYRKIGGLVVETLIAPESEGSAPAA